MIITGKRGSKNISSQGFPLSCHSKFIVIAGNHLNQWKKWSFTVPILVKGVDELYNGTGIYLSASLISRWARGLRKPRDRELILGVIKVFNRHGAILDLPAANHLLKVSDHLPLNRLEIMEINTSWLLSSPPNMVST